MVNKTVLSIIGKNIKLTNPDSKEMDLQGIVAVDFIFEKPDNKIIDFGEGQINGNYHQIQIKFDDNANSIYVSEIPPGQSSTAVVGKPPAYTGKALKFTIDQMDKNTLKKIATTTTTDGSRWDVQYQSMGKGVSSIQVLDTGIPPTEELPENGTVKEDWGGSKDRTTWVVVGMEKTPSLWKVVDNNNKNIAADFTSKLNA